MKEFKSPELEVIQIAVEDVITSSTTGNNGNASEGGSVGGGDIGL